MRKIPPSEQIRQEISSLLTEGSPEETDILTQLVKKALQRVLQEALEQEVTDHLGREHYQRRRGDEPHQGYRNGYEPRQVKTAEGAVRVKVPQVRETPEPYRSKLLSQVTRSVVETAGSVRGRGGLSMG